MAWYRAYFLNQKFRIADVAEFQSASDEQALTAAHDLLAKRPLFAGVELWQEKRPVSVDHPVAIAA